MSLESERKRKKSLKEIRTASELTASNVDYKINNKI